ncbi:MAG: S41 family peptidase [Bacteroidaceae bacterium]|nr:S41 family peptidase [Bacteroidaceae bacterium]
MKRSRLLILYFSFLIFNLSLLTGCVREDQPDNTPINNFEALWKIIDEHYCFLDYKAEAIGLDWDEVHTTYRQRISNDMTNAQLQEVLTDMLAELRDGHVNLYTAADVSRYWSWYEDYPKNLDIELRDQYLGTDYKIAAGIKYRIFDDNIGYLLYEDFSVGVGEGNLDDVMYYLRTCNGLIIDVRGNSGGMLTYAERLSQRLTNKRILVGYSSYKTGKGHSDFSQPKAEYLNPSTGVRWQKPVVILTNRECYSATNIFIRNAHACEGVTLLGDQSGGGSGLPFSSELPNGWAVRFSASPSYDKDMNQIEFGIEPDIYCALDATDALNGYDTLIETARALLH